jgi:hypothetical protein
MCPSLTTQAEALGPASLTSTAGSRTGGAGTAFPANGRRAVGLSSRYFCSHGSLQRLNGPNTSLPGVPKVPKIGRALNALNRQQVETRLRRLVSSILTGLWTEVSE